MSIKQWDTPKDPDEVKDYGLVWDIEPDAIASSTWSVVGPDDALVIDDDSFANDATVEVRGETLTDQKLTTVWFGATGTPGVTYRLLNRITTTGGRTLDQTVKLVVEPK